MERNKVRASGETAATAEAKEAAAQVDQPVTVTLPEESPQWQSRTPKFARMRFDWATPEDRLAVERARTAVEGRIVREFADAFSILNGIYGVIRDPELHPDGTPVTDQWGYPVWKRTPDGFYLEDFTRLSHKQMEHYTGIITTRLFEWEQAAADLWAQAMFAKAQFEDRFAIAFDAPMSGTVDDRRAAGTKDAAEERYFAIYVTHLSRRADAVVRSMERLAQRLKDLLTA